MRVARGQGGYFSRAGCLQVYDAHFDIMAVGALQVYIVQQSSQGGAPRINYSDRSTIIELYKSRSTVSNIAIIVLIHTSITVVQSRCHWYDTTTSINSARLVHASTDSSTVLILIVGIEHPRWEPCGVCVFTINSCK